MTDGYNSCNAPCIWIENLSKRVDKMEDTFGNVNNKVIDIDKRYSLTEILLAKLEAAFTNNTNAIISIEKTMISMQNDIKNNAYTTMRIEREVGEIKEKFDAAEEVAKLDLRVVFKRFIDNKVTWILGGGITIVTLLELLSRIDWDNLSKAF